MDPVRFARLVGTDKISEVLDDARHSAIAKILSDLGDSISESARPQLSVILDYSISGICPLNLCIYIWFPSVLRVTNGLNLLTAPPLTVGAEREWSLGGKYQRRKREGLTESIRADSVKA